MSDGTGLQVLVVSDITSRVLFDDAIQLGIGQVLNLSLVITSLLLCYHGFLKRQVAPGYLVQGTAGKQKADLKDSIMLKCTNSFDSLCPSLLSCSHKVHMYACECFIFCSKWGSYGIYIL